MAFLSVGNGRVCGQILVFNVSSVQWSISWNVKYSKESSSIAIQELHDGGKEYNFTVLPKAFLKQKLFSHRFEMQQDLQFITN